MELNLKILAPLLQCTSIYRCALFIIAKKYINFLFCVHITFWFFILSAFHSPCLSPHCLSISSFFLHRPPLHHRSNKPSRRPFSPLPIAQAQPLQTLLSIVDLTSPTVDPFLHRRSHKLPTLFSIIDLTSLAATNPSLHRQSHKLSRHKPFSPLPISQAQPPQTLPFCFALIPFRSRRTKPRRWWRNRAISIS